MSTRILQVGDQVLARYFELFVNRRAHTLQSSKPHPESGKHYYYRPKGTVSLSAATLRRHLKGEITIGLYAINPETQRCKWVAIDADYARAIEDLLKLQWELRQNGIDAALEKSRRGGHLWMFAAEPLLARDCRVYIYNLAKRLSVPVKGGLADGIEVFPKQDAIPHAEFGNAIRGPLGVHRGSGQRYWFYGADYGIDAQLEYLSRLKRLSELEMKSFISGLEMPREFVPQPATPFASGSRVLTAVRNEFRILQHVTPGRKSGRNYWTRCPSCAQAGRDRGRDNLAICVADPRKYKCWAGCTKEQIRAALGCPIRQREAG